MKPNPYWYEYPLREDERNTLQRSDAGQEVLALFDYCNRKKNAALVYRYIVAGTLAAAVFGINVYRGTPPLISLVIAFGISLMIFIWSWFILAEEKNSKVKGSATIIADHCVQNGETQVGTILQRIMAYK